MAAEFSQDSFEAEVLKSDQPVLVDFFGDHCPPCKRLAPVIDELATENEGTFKIGKVNVNDNMELAMKYAVTAVPTLLVFKGGEVVERTQGFQDKDKLQAMLNNHSTV